MTLKRPANVQYATSEIHVLPVKAQRLPLSQPERDGNGEQRGKAVADSRT